MAEISHALMLNMHQPSGNLDELLADNTWEAKEILWAYDRVPRSLWGYEDLARVHLSLSGTLLETLSNPDFQSRAYGIIDCGSLLWHWQNDRIIRVVGTGYYHPVLALIPPADWDEQVGRWLGIGEHLFGGRRFAGFWPPEMGFTMELIPVLKRFGYRYVLVDSLHVEPIDEMSWSELRYRPHIAEFEGEEIIVVVRDRELSDAQLSGMDWGWFAYEVNERTRWCDFPPLVTTCTDGDNGGWFRNTNPNGNFWTYFYQDLLGKRRAGDSNIQPVFIDDYLDRYGAHGRVKVATGAWNTGWHHGVGFLQWIGSQRQKDALARVWELSEALHRARKPGHSPHVQHILDEAQWRLLRAETSCNIFWGEAWVERCERDLDAVAHHLHEAGGLAA